MKAEFDDKAVSWDDDPIRVERAIVIGEFLKERLDLSGIKNALEYGSGTGLLSFAMKDQLKQVTLMDESLEMTRVASEKIANHDLKGFKALQYDLMKNPLPDQKYDLIYILLTLHHIIDYPALLNKFSQLLTAEGALVIIDLEKEDGSFHEGDFHGHNGFDRQELVAHLNNVGFEEKNYEVCYVLNRKFDDGTTRNYPLFMMIAAKTV